MQIYLFLSTENNDSLNRNFIVIILELDVRVSFQTLIRLYNKICINITNTFIYTSFLVFFMDFIQHVNCHRN